MSKKGIVFLWITFIVFLVLSVYFYNLSVSFKIPNKINYTERSTINYKIYPKSDNFNTFYNEGLVYDSNNTSIIQTNLNYSKNMDLNTNYNVKDYEYVSFLITDLNDQSKIIYKKNEKIGKSDNITNNINIKKEVSIDYNKYKKIYNKYKEKYNAPISAKLSIVCKIKSRDAFDNVNNYSLGIELPITDDYFNITKIGEIDKEDAIILDSTKTKVNNSLLFTSIVFIIIDIVILVLILDSKKKKTL
jgi:hypothetical protein